MRDLIVLILAIMFAAFMIYSKPAKSSEAMDRAEEVIAYVGLGFTILSLIKPTEEKSEAPKELPNVIRPPSTLPPPIEEPQPQNKDREIVKPKKSENTPGVPTKYFVPKFAPGYGR